MVLAARFAPHPGLVRWCIWLDVLWCYTHDMLECLLSVWGGGLTIHSLSLDLSGVCFWFGTVVSGFARAHIPYTIINPPTPHSLRLANHTTGLHVQGRAALWRF